eukprot:INCI15017.4.p1 GENE.INCI15017.4~~INCI15017.4.p1  ORF type:complete len:119 (+),score=26.18 INCI15017.4:546-902(+)
MEDGSLIPVLLLGNKCDLNASEVPQDWLGQFCSDHGFVGWLETSAKADTNVQEAAEMIVQNILERLRRIEGLKANGQLEDAPQDENVVDPSVPGGARGRAAAGGGSAAAQPPKKKGCC